MSVYSKALNMKESNDKSALKIKLQIKVLVLLFSAITLSWCFEGWRQIKAAPTLPHFALLTLGIISTALLLWMQAFWIYVEEKSKGSLAKKVVHFDRLQAWLEKKTNKKGDSQ